MTRRSRIILSIIFVGSAVIFFVAVVSVFLPLKNLLVSDDRVTVVGPLRKTTTTSCTTRPISLQEAIKLFDFPFPKTATNIQFANYNEFLAYNVAVRFEAPNADCIAAVPVILDYQGFAKTTPLSNESRALRPVSNMSFDKRQDFGALVVPWFNPEQIRVGLETGHPGSYQPKVWIDTERGIFYYQLGD